MINPRKAAGLIWRATSFWLNLPGLTTVWLAKKAGRRLLVDLRTKGAWRVKLLLVDGTVGFLVDGSR
jgi:hypothetical protein